jgi:MATE family multidrug resistance protein
VLRGAGDSRSALYAAIAANIVNIGISYFLIFGHGGLPKLGVAGSAWGAASARLTSAAILLALLASGRRKISIRGRAGWRPVVRTGKAIFRLGVPAAIQEMLTSAGFLTLLAVVATLGTSALAAQQIGFTVLSLAYMPGFAFGVASTALVGQSIGANRPGDGTRAVGISVRWGAAWMGVGGAICMAFAHPLMSAFTGDQAVIENGMHALRALGLGLPFWAIWFVFGGALRGIGDTRTPMLAAATGVWGAVALAYGAVTLLDGGLGSVWLTFLVTAPIAAAINYSWFRRTMTKGIDFERIAERLRLGH